LIWRNAIDSLSVCDCDVRGPGEAEDAHDQWATDSVRRISPTPPSPVRLGGVVDLLGGAVDSGLRCLAAELRAVL
jgi:hypothetical protein